MAFKVIDEEGLLEMREYLVIYEKAITHIQ
jgi:hypothetical protein